MNTRNIIMATLLLLASFSKLEAQSFNTISNSRPAYKVEKSALYTKKEVSSENDTSSVVIPIVKDSIYNEQTEQPRYPLSVSYPLRQSKLHVSSPYGYRKHPILGVTKFHNGIDLRAKREPVYAMLPGKVVKTGYDNVSGNFIILQHASLRVSYCHLSYIDCKQGDSVYAGQPLGICGSTGRSTGVHLHLTLKINGQICDPTPLLNYVGFI